MRSILDAERPLHLPDRASLARECGDLRSHNGTKRCATAPTMHHHSHSPSRMTLQPDNTVDDLVRRSSNAPQRHQRGTRSSTVLSGCSVMREGEWE